MICHLGSISEVYTAVYRMIRQDSQLWDDLHQGVLTTGKLNACLGFYEPQAARRLGIGKGFVSHRALLSVYHHLLQDVFVPPTQVSILFNFHVGFVESIQGFSKALQRLLSSANKD